jgi:hypothetical protein
MKRLLIGLSFFAGALAPSLSQAQVMIEMNEVTCDQFLKMPADQEAKFAAWMSGYYNQKMNSTVVDLDGLVKNIESVKTWCASNPKESVMAGLQRAVDKMK